MYSAQFSWKYLFRICIPQADVCLGHKSESSELSRAKSKLEFVFRDVLLFSFHCKISSCLTDACFLLLYTRSTFSTKYWVRIILVWMQFTESISYPILHESFGKFKFSRTMQNFRKYGYVRATYLLLTVCHLWWNMDKVDEKIICELKK